jgi:tRNA (mo5U34)-methyltransferase
MGVLYHQRSPLEHLRKMRESLRPGGELVLETIYLPGDDAFASTPPDRYARMKNVWLLPTLAELATWLERSAFRNVQVLDQSVTTSDEQRSTEWMPFESLAEALDPDDASLTVEGWPAPHRVVISATAPG